MTIYCVKRSNNTLAQAYFTQAEADAAALLIAGSTVVSVSLSPDLSTPPDMYVSEIITALETVIGSIGGIVSHKWAYALDCLEDADLPAMVYEFADFVDQADTLTEKYFTQLYQINAYRISKLDKAHTAETEMANTILARNVVKATPQLGLGATYTARPRRITMENQLQQIFRESAQPRQAHLMEIIITKQEDETA